MMGLFKNAKQAVLFQEAQTSKSNQDVPAAETSPLERNLKNCDRHPGTACPFQHRPPHDCSSLNLQDARMSKVSPLPGVCVLSKLAVMCSELPRLAQGPEETLGSPERKKGNEAC